MKLIFVYNADSGPVSGLLDVAHKMFQPETYQCALCALTHDTFAEKEIWKDFRERNQASMVFLHKDEFEKKYGKGQSYPIILSENGDALDEVLSPADLNKIKKVEDLIAKMEAVMAQKT